MKYLSNILFAAVFAVVSTLTFGITDSKAQEAQTPDGDDVVSVINESDDHSIFAELIAEAQLTETLTQQGPFTVLAPTDEAFENANPQVDELREDPQQLQNVIINHLFQGEASSDEVETNFGVEVADGDIDASNGVIHSIDEVIIEQ